MKKKLLITVTVPSSIIGPAPDGLLETLRNDAKQILGGLSDLKAFSEGNVELCIVEVKFATTAFISVQPVMGLQSDYDLWTMFCIAYAKMARLHLKVWVKNVVAKLEPIDPAFYGDSSQHLARAA